MDAKEVATRTAAIQKAMTAGEGSGSLLKLLGDLKEGVKPTEELLRSTRVGVVVNRLRTNKDPKVAQLATTLVNKWREEVNKEKRKSQPGTAAPRAATNTASPASASQSPAPSKAAAKKHAVAPDKRNDTTDKVNVNVTGNKTRDGCVRLMYNGLAFMSEESKSRDFCDDPQPGAPTSQFHHCSHTLVPDVIFPIACNVEAAAFKDAKNETTDAYKTKMRSLYQNLKNKSNPELRKRVLSGDITPARFVTMSHEEMKSAERRAEDERLEKENMNQAMVAQVEKSISASLTCGKCKQKKVSYSQAQTRSADEPMTTFCECMNCGHRWKFS